jgi:hypothetical protein
MPPPRAAARKKPLCLIPARPPFSHFEPPDIYNQPPGNKPRPPLRRSGVLPRGRKRQRRGRANPIDFGAPAPADAAALHGAGAHVPRRKGFPQRQARGRGLFHSPGLPLRNSTRSKRARAPGTLRRARLCGRAPPSCGRASGYCIGPTAHPSVQLHSTTWGAPANPTSPPAFSPLITHKPQRSPARLGPQPQPAPHLARARPAPPLAARRLLAGRLRAARGGAPFYTCRGFPGQTPNSKYPPATLLSPPESRHSTGNARHRSQASAARAPPLAPGAGAPPATPCLPAPPRRGLVGARSLIASVLDPLRHP